jgi:RNA polymerase sigma factor (sigma-70 family)
MTGERASTGGQPEADLTPLPKPPEPVDERAEDEEAARLVRAFKAGDKEAFTPLYKCYFERVYGYMRVAIKDRHEAEDLAQQVFAQVFEKLPDYEERSQPFRAWLFVVARNYVVSFMRKQERIDVVEPAEIDRRRDRGVEDDRTAAWVLEWIKGADLFILFERLPLPQRQVLALRFLYGLETKEIAETMKRTETDVRGLQHRGLVFMRKRLKALGRIGEDGELLTMRARFQQAPVLRSRRFMLDK